MRIYINHAVIQCANKDRCYASIYFIVETVTELMF